MSIIDRVIRAFRPENFSNYEQDETIKIIYDASIPLKCSIMTRVRAMFIYHELCRLIGQTRYEPYLTAAACLSLSIKANEDCVQIQDVLLQMFCIVNQGAFQSTLEEDLLKTKKSLIHVECLILRMLNFNIMHPVAHQFLAYFMREFIEELGDLWPAFSTTCMSLVTDFYRSNKCLDHKPEDIAIAVIFMSLYMNGVEQNDCLKIRLKRLNNCSDDILYAIVEDIFNICDLGSFIEQKKLENP